MSPIDRAGSRKKTINNSTAVIYLKNADGRYLTVNHQFERLFNVKREQILGKTDCELYGLENRVAERFTELAKANEKLRCQIAERIRTEKESGLILAGFRHLTEVVQLRATELQGIIDCMDEGAFVCDITGKLTLANRRGLEIVGLNAPLKAKIGISELTHLLQSQEADGSPIASCKMALARALEGEVVTDLEESIVTTHAGKDLHFRWNGSPLRDHKGTIVGAVAVVRDVTGLRELDRLKDQFLEVAAHELKTPVAIMKGYAQALLRTTAESPNRRRILEAIARGADRIDIIVNKLLDISRLELGPHDLAQVSFDLNSPISEVINRVALTAPNHHIELIAAEGVVVRGDKDRIEQVLINLIDNAIRYSPNGGAIKVELKVKNGEAIVSVEDHGVGIPREKQASIFQRFYRAHTGTPYDFGGMGMGLFISKEIISKHAGRMGFESEERKGSIFCFSLPLDQTGDREVRKLDIHRDY